MKLKYLLRGLASPKVKVWGFVFLIICLIFIFSKAREQGQKVVYRSTERPSFREGRILGTPRETYLRSKELQLERVAKKITTQNRALVERIGDLEQRLEEKLGETAGESTRGDEEPPAATGKAEEKAGDEVIGGQKEGKEVRVNVPNGDDLAPLGPSLGLKPIPIRPSSGRSGRIISFPVKHKRKEKGVVLPTGSYVKAKLMTGVDAPEGKTYPVLLALDYSYQGPNQHKIDLSGCFIVAKSSASLSTERMSFQAQRLSCVSKRGEFFERKINGFVADDIDNSFAVAAKVNSRQGRVAKMAFLKSLIDGIGEIIGRKAQNIGGKNPDSANVVLQSGAQHAASKVSDWYLKQAQSLMPSLSVNSGQDVWVVMQESVLLPNQFFKRNVNHNRRNKNAKVFSYLSRIID